MWVPVSWSWSRNTSTSSARSSTSRDCLVPLTVSSIFVMGWQSGSRFCMNGSRQHLFDRAFRHHAREVGAVLARRVDIFVHVALVERQAFERVRARLFRQRLFRF